MDHAVNYYQYHACVAVHHPTSNIGKGRDQFLDHILTV